MSDKEKLMVLLVEFGVQFRFEKREKEEGTTIVCECGDTKISGWAGFYTTFKFDADGKFQEMGAWE